MKDIIITAEKVKRELYILLGCFIVAVLINIGAIVYFDTSWIEVLTQLGYVVIIAAFLYVLVLIVRCVVFLFARYVFRKKK